jgi:hypothetical protein
MSSTCGLYKAAFSSSAVGIFIGLFIGSRVQRRRDDHWGPEEEEGAAIPLFDGRSSSNNYETALQHQFIYAII